MSSPAVFRLPPPAYVAVIVPAKAELEPLGPVHALPLADQSLLQRLLAALAGVPVLLALPQEQIPSDLPPGVEATPYFADTAEILRHITFAPFSHLIVLPSDLLILDVSTLFSLIDCHRQHSSDRCCTILLQDVGEQDEQGLPVKEKARKLPRTPDQIEYLLLQNDTHRVWWKQKKSVVEDDPDLVGQTPKVHLPKRRLPCRLRTDWQDAHVYVLAPSVRTLLTTTQTSLRSIEHDLVPWLIAQQQQQPDSGGVYAHVVPSGQVLRITSLPSYLHAAGLCAHTDPTTQVGDKVTLQASCVGPSVQLGTKCRLNHVVLMQGVTVGDHSVLQNCVVARNVKIGEHCKLNDCQVLSDVPAQTKAKGQVWD